MKTVICLQKSGFANHPSFKLVVMGQKKNRQGRFIEHLGNWQPIKRKTRDRTISLNKPRVLYWLAQGAEPCPKIKKFLSYIGYTPPVMHPLGRLTHYPKTNLKPTRYFDDKESYKRLRKYYSFHYNTYRAEEEEDKLYKEYLIASKGVLGDKIAQMTSMEQLNDTLQTEEYERTVNGKESTNDLQQRSHIFYQIRYLLDKYAASYDNAQILERIHRKLNMLAEQGIMAETTYQTKILQSGITEKQMSIVRKDESNYDKLQSVKLDHLLVQRQQKLQGFMQMMSGISKQQYGKTLMESRGFSAQEAQEATEFEFDMAKLTHKVPTKQDASEYGIFESDDDVAAEQVADLDDDSHKQDSMFMPKSSPLHSFPDLYNYSPKDYYDTSKGVSHAIEEQFNYDRAYSLGNIDEHKVQEQSKKWKHMNFKASVGKPLKRKKWFSTFVRGQNISVLEMSEMKINIVPVVFIKP